MSFFYSIPQTRHVPVLLVTLKKYPPTPYKVIRMTFLPCLSVTFPSLHTTDDPLVVPRVPPASCHSFPFSSSFPCPHSSPCVTGGGTFLNRKRTTWLFGGLPKVSPHYIRLNFKSSRWDQRLISYLTFRLRSSTQSRENDIRFILRYRRTSLVVTFPTIPHLRSLPNFPLYDCLIFIPHFFSIVSTSVPKTGLVGLLILTKIQLFWDPTIPVLISSSQDLYSSNPTDKL